jgi:hypothetical protein
MRACLRVCPAFQHVDRFSDLRVDKTWRHELCATGDHANIRTSRSRNVVWYQTLENTQLWRDFFTLEMGRICCPETSVRNYHYSLRRNPEERSSHSAFVKVKTSRILSKIVIAVQNVLFVGLMVLTTEASELRIWSQYLHEDRPMNREHKYTLCATYFTRRLLQTWWGCVNLRLSPEKRVYIFLIF